MSIRNDERFRALWKGETPILVDGNKIVVRYWHPSESWTLMHIESAYRAIKSQWERERKDDLILRTAEQFVLSHPEFDTEAKNDKVRLMIELVQIFDAAGHADFEIVGEECPPEPPGSFLKKLAAQFPRIRAAVERIESPLS